MPDRKVTAGALAGSATAIMTWALNQFAGVQLPGEVAVACATILTFGVSYMVPNQPGGAR
jgi:hypothetical protein